MLHEETTVNLLPNSRTLATHIDQMLNFLSQVSTREQRTTVPVFSKGMGEGYLGGAVLKDSCAKN